MFHKSIFSYLESISDKWPEISQELGLSDEACRKIYEGNPNNTLLCCSQMVEEWLLGGEVNPSWHALTEALKTLNMGPLADDILLHWGER